MDARVACDGALGGGEIRLQRAQLGDDAVKGGDGRAVRVGSGQGVAHGLVGLGESLHVRATGGQHALGRGWVVFHGGEGFIGGAGHGVVAGIGSGECLLGCGARGGKPSGRSSGPLVPRSPKER